MKNFTEYLAETTAPKKTSEKPVTVVKGKAEKILAKKINWGNIKYYDEDEVPYMFTPEERCEAVREVLRHSRGKTATYTTIEKQINYYIEPFDKSKDKEDMYYLEPEELEEILDAMEVAGEIADVGDDNKRGLDIRAKYKLIVK